MRRFFAPARYNTTAEYIFFGGKRIAVLPAGGNPSYYVEDLLGTSRVLTTNTGVVCYDADFYPYGGERSYTNTCPQNYKFEGKERDTETGNDDFGARYYSNRFGRWLSADWSAIPEAVPYANLSNPQTLNLYAMVSDDPESFADLDGHDSVMEAIIRLAGGSPGNPGPALKNLAIGAAKGLANLAIGFANTVRGDDRQINGEDGPRQPADAIPELEPKNTGEVMGAIAAPMVLGAVVGGLAEGAASTTTVTHFTSDAGVEAIAESGALRAGTYVTTPAEIPAGATSGQVESLLEIGPGKGANSITFDTPNSNLKVPANGPTTSGGAAQFQLKNPTPINPSKFKPTPPGGPTVVRPGGLNTKEAGGPAKTVTQHTGGPS